MPKHNIQNWDWVSTEQVVGRIINECQHNRQINLTASYKARPTRKTYQLAANATCPSVKLMPPQKDSVAKAT